jgi:hypothetical protein
MKSSFDLGYERKGLNSGLSTTCWMPPNGKIRKLMLFQVKSMSNLQKERLKLW